MFGDEGLEARCWRDQLPWLRTFFAGRRKCRRVQVVAGVGLLAHEPLDVALLACLVLRGAKPA